MKNDGCLGFGIALLVLQALNGLFPFEKIAHFEIDFNSFAGINA